MGLLILVAVVSSVSAVWLDAARRDANYHEGLANAEAEKTRQANEALTQESEKVRQANIQIGAEAEKVRLANVRIGAEAEKVRLANIRIEAEADVARRHLHGVRMTAALEAWEHGEWGRARLLLENEDTEQVELAASNGITCGSCSTTSGPGPIRRAPLSTCWPSLPTAGRWRPRQGRPRRMRSCSCGTGRLERFRSFCNRGVS